MWIYHPFTRIVIIWIALSSLFHSATELHRLRCYSATQENDFLELNHACPPGFVYISQPRISRRGGGLAILHNSIYKASPLTLQTYASFESAALMISGQIPTVLAVIYRPPKYSNIFLDEFSAFLTFSVPYHLILFYWVILTFMWTMSVTHSLEISFLAWTVLVSSNMWTFQPTVKVTLWTLSVVQVLHP